MAGHVRVHTTVWQFSTCPVIPCVLASDSDSARALLQLGGLVHRQDRVRVTQAPDDKPLRAEAGEDLVKGDTMKIRF